MNNSENRETYSADRYLFPVNREKAPEGFTERVMMRIGVENSPANVPVRSRNETLIPAYAVIITMALIITALLSNPKEGIIPGQITGILKSLNGWLPAFEMSDLPVINVPSILVYISTGIFVLTIFDLALNRLFHYRKKS